MSSPQHMYNAGSIYDHVDKSAPGAEEVIGRADDLPAGAHLYTDYNGHPALVTGGELYLWAGKEPGFQSIDWSRINK